MIKYVVEFIGTFIFLSVISRVNNPMVIALTLLVMIYFGGTISGGHFNPAVSFMMYLQNNMKTHDFIMYVLSQIIGASSAVLFKNLL